MNETTDGGADGMLNKKKIKSLLPIFSFAFVCTSCTEKVSDVAMVGLVEGNYGLKSVNVEDTIPNGWKFGGNSYFEFKKNETGNYAEKKNLPNGLWGMDKFTYENGTSNFIYGEYVMEWHNTPFDDIPPLGVGGFAVFSDNTVFFNMYPINGGGFIVSKWGDIKYVSCYVTPVKKNDYTKRKIRIEFSETGNDTMFSLTFSM